MRTLLILLTLLSHSATAQVSNLYARVEARLARNPKLAESLGTPPAELQEVRWLLGRWTVRSRVFAHGDEFSDAGESVVTETLGGTWLEIRDSYEGEADDLGLLTFNPVTKTWISVGVDSTGNSIVSRGTREGNRYVFLAENAEIVGERVTLRQTMEKVSDREYRVLNEERLVDGTWARIDEYVYKKK